MNARAERTDLLFLGRGKQNLDCKEERKERNKTNRGLVYHVVNVSVDIDATMLVFASLDI